MATKKRQRDAQKRLRFGKEKYQERNNYNAERGVKFTYMTQNSTFL